MSADLAVHAVIEGTTSSQLEVVAHDGTLPELKTTSVNLYVAKSVADQASNDLLSMIRTAYIDL